MNRRRLTLDRRRFLTAVGATGLTMSFLRALPSYAAGTDKRYLILLFTPNGVVRHLWGADSTGTNPGDFTLRPWLAPLAPFKDKLVVIHGLANKAANGGSHGPGMVTLWTGDTITSDGTFASGISIDQAIAAQLNAGTPFPSIALRARSPLDYTAKDPQSRMIYSGPNSPVDPREDVLAALSDLFVGIPAAGSTTPPPVDPAITRRDEIRKRLYGRLDAELGRINPKLCSDDQHQLEALREGWAALTASLGRSGPGTGAISTCSQPAGLTGSTDYRTTIKENIDLLVMALACDLTRVASLQFSAARSPMVFDWLGHTLDHHSISHTAPQPSSLGPNLNMGQSDPEHPTADQLATYAVPIQQMTDINLFYAQQVAYLAQQLAAFQVDSTTTLLDQCIICWGNELDNGSNHDHFAMPFVLIGGGNGHLKTNQLVEFPLADPYKPLSNAQYAHNDLLVTLAQAMGVTSITTFGDASLNRGAITSILA